MRGDGAAPRRRLTLVDGDASADAGEAAVGTPPQVMLIPIEPSQSPVVGELAFELARALAAQTARTGAIVYAHEAALPKARRVGSRKSVLGPLSGLQLDPRTVREGVMFFDVDRVGAVSAVVRAQMPQVLISDDGLQLPGATAGVIVAPHSARSEYVQLLRGELETDTSRRSLVVQIECDRAAGGLLASLLGGRKPSPLRAQAWELAAELVLAG